MRTRNRSLKAQAGWLLPAALSSVLFGCPNQELAPLQPCTVSGVSLEVPQSGVDKVDLLFVIDNSGSMAEEQKKLAGVLPNLVTVLTTGFKTPKPAGTKPDFPPVKSLHIGIVSSDMGVNGITGQQSCGDVSFDPAAPDPSNPAPAVRQNPPSNGLRYDKPRGDDGIMNTSVAVALAGISARPPGTTFSTPVAVVVPGDTTCMGVAAFPAGQRFIDFSAGMSDPNVVAKQFSCLAKLGKNGCGLEQQLDSMLKSVTPSTNAMIKFVAGSNGHGDGQNRGFLRPDAILAIVQVTDEEDCSIQDTAQSRELFNPGSATITEDINIRCGLAKYEPLLHPVTRYVSGLRALKDPAFSDRIIFAGIVGVPPKTNPSNPEDKVYSGGAELNALLSLPAMQFVPRQIPNTMLFEPTPACQSATDGSAAPARRFVNIAKEFDTNGVITSICEPEYGSALNVLIERIAAQLTGACLPRKLNRDGLGAVACDVVEVMPNNQIQCSAAKGRIETLPERTINGTRRTVCRVQQVLTPNGMRAGGTGWYYDDFTEQVKNDCQQNPQRISFTDDANPETGSQVRFECFQPVAGATETSVGVEAIGYSCAGGKDEVCGTKSAAGETLICVGGTCQLACGNDSDCPNGWVCDGNPLFCKNPTCPPAESN